MVRTLYALGILAWLLTGLVSVLCARNGRSNAPFADAATPSIVERFQQSIKGRKAPNIRPTSSLVRQAQLFALCIDPPAPPKPHPTPAAPKAERFVAQAPEVRPPSTSPKFELRGISYRPSRPEDSMALIWQADTGHRWVRQGAQLGHLVISEIKGDGVLYSDGNQTRQMALNVDQARTAVARKQEAEPVDKKPKRTAPVVAHWTPVRRIRQIPRARVAARLGSQAQNAN